MSVLNYNNEGKSIEPKEIILNHSLIYALLKKYLNEV